MALTTAQKAEKAYKKSVLGVAMTADDKSYYTEPASPLTAKSTNIWIDDDKIPAVAPTPVAGATYDENGVDIAISGLPGIIQYIEVDMLQIPGAPNSFKTPATENDAISFIDFDGEYAPVFVDNATSQVIPVGLNNMEFDAASGTLTFYSGKPSALNSVKAKYWRYVGRKLSSLKAALEGNVVITAFPIYNGAPNTSLAGNTFTLTHNKNTTEFTWSLLEGNKFINPTSLVVIDANNIEITLESVPTELDNVVLKFIELAGLVQVNEESEPSSGLGYKSIAINAMTTFEEWQDDSYVFEIGSTYVISYVEPGDDFTNIGYTADDVPFVATGTTATNWTNGTYVTRYGIIAEVMGNDTGDTFTLEYDYGNNRELKVTGTNDTFTANKLFLIGNNVSYTRDNANVVSFVGLATYDITYGSGQPNPTSIELRIYPE